MTGWILVARDGAETKRELDAPVTRGADVATTRPPGR
jgi:hypothetical protein